MSVTDGDREAQRDVSEAADAARGRSARTTTTASTPRRVAETTHDELQPFRAFARTTLVAAALAVFAVQVTDLKERSMEIRVLMSATNAGRMFDLRCLVREALLAWLARDYPASLPRQRQADVGGGPG